MAEKEFFINDNVIIPDYIKRMSVEEIEAEIQKILIKEGKVNPISQEKTANA